MIKGQQIIIAQKVYTKNPPKCLKKITRKTNKQKPTWFSIKWNGNCNPNI